ncbi:MAG: D-glycero-beta-D-manno-heptose 1-phosphate adenylyltransferase [Candidatus Omnitrophica bacterium]|nr:D-glycero-beta-D-manno-heptose 1-phosphate adenylyltransferase [Candidatus Omnitrophota bacterium]
MTSKIKTREELAGLVKALKVNGVSVGFTNGCFDILHVGHVTYLAGAREKCGKLVVGVNSDASVKRLKGPERPINNESARARVLAALECVDFVVIFVEDTPLELIKAITPDILFKGGDWTSGTVVGSGYVKENGGDVVIVPYVDGYSTTGIIQKMRE